MEPSQHETGDKIDLIVTVCGRLADILKDPTEGGAHKEMSSEARNTARADAHYDLTKCIDTLASCASFHYGYFDVVNIAHKLQINVNDAEEYNETATK